MAKEIIIAAEQAWDIRPMGGVDRISGTELGRRLAYCVAEPAKFNKQVIEKLLKAGKINDSDMAIDQSPCKRGFGKATVTEYWLPLPLARSIAIEHVHTKVADGLRQQVAGQLERLIGERTTALRAPTDVMALIQAGFDRQTALLERQGELFLSMHQQPKSPSIYIDEERVHLLKRMAQDIAAARGESAVQPIWQTVQRKYKFIKARPKSHPRVFDTVLVDRFDEVLEFLRAELEKALNAPKKTISSLMQRPLPLTGDSIDIQTVSRRLMAMGLDIPAWALADWGPAKGLYSMVDVLIYVPTDSGKKSDTNRPVHIDSSSIPKISQWCVSHPLELEVYLSNRRVLNATLSPRQKVSGVPDATER